MSDGYFHTWMDEEGEVRIRYEIKESWMETDIERGRLSSKWSQPKLVEETTGAHTEHGLLGEDDKAVNHPVHYNLHPSGIECIEIVRHMNFNLGNVIKYLWRCGLKTGTVDLEDLKKARWYLDDEIKSIEARAKVKS